MRHKDRMKIDEQAMMRFFRGECTAAEAKQIAEYLRTHREIMDTLFDENEWLHTLNDGTYPALPYREEELLGTIQKKLHGSRKSGKVKMLRPWMKWTAAACIVVGVALSIILQAPAPKQPAAVATADISVSDSITWSNSTSQPESRYLSDGSLVVLQPGSVLHYRKDFEPCRRMLYLEGVAKFTVAKNPDRPFTVMAGEVSTTAVGTIFTVNSIGKQHPLTVKLWEGKVIVKNIKQPGNIVQLSPGEGCAFDGKILFKMNALPVVRPQTICLAEKPEVPQPDNTCQSNGSNILFKNASLPTVFNALNNLYGIKILYQNVPDTALTKALYSGSFDKTKVKAQQVVSAITLVNDLKWEQVDSTTYLINPN